MKKFQKLNKQNYSDQIINQIKDMIERGELKPGDKLPPERELAVKWGVSRLPIREALKTLQFIKVLEGKQGEGYIIRSLDNVRLLDLIEETSEFGKIMEDYKEVRLILEVKAAELACVRRNERDLQKIALAIEEMEKELQHDPDDGGVRGSLLFHDAVLKASHNKLIQSIYYFYNEIVYEGRLRAKKIPGGYMQSLQEHKAIYEAIRDKDIKTASEQMRRHIDMVSI
jgi:GntR family transcriptional repressor for pyruvate dehydrogenase complex